MKLLTSEQITLINSPLPTEAITQHPTKTYLSSIKSIYVTLRLNEVFWFGGWTLKVKHQETWDKWMVVVHVTFEAPEYWFYYECFGGNDNGWETSKNFDLWDAYKWATTDAISKIASWIGIGADVYKWKKWTAPYPKNEEDKLEDEPEEWFKDENLVKMSVWKYASADEAVKMARKKYKVSKQSANAIRHFVNTWEVNLINTFPKF